MYLQCIFMCGRACVSTRCVLIGTCALCERDCTSSVCICVLSDMCVWACVCVCTCVWQWSDSCPLLGCKPFCAQCGQTAHSSIWKMLTLLIKGQTRVIMISLCWEGRDGGGEGAGRRVKGELEGGGEGGGGLCRPQGLSAHPTHTRAHTATDTHTNTCRFPFSLF